MPSLFERGEPVRVISSAPVLGRCWLDASGTVLASEAEQVTVLMRMPGSEPGAGISMAIAFHRSQLTSEAGEEVDRFLESIPGIVP